MMLWRRLWRDVNRDPRFLSCKPPSRTVFLQLLPELDDDGRLSTETGITLLQQVSIIVALAPRVVRRALAELQSKALVVVDDAGLFVPAFAERQGTDAVATPATHERTAVQPVSTDAERRRKRAERQQRWREKQRDARSSVDGEASTQPSTDRLPVDGGEASTQRLPPSTVDAPSQTLPKNVDRDVDTETRANASTRRLPVDASTPSTETRLPATEKATVYSAEDLLEALRQGGAKVQSQAGTKLLQQLGSLFHQNGLTPERMRAIGRRLATAPPEFWRDKPVTVTRLLGTENDGKPLTILINECEEPPKPTPSKPGQGTGALAQIKRERAERHGPVTLGQINTEVGRG